MKATTLKNGQEIFVAESSNGKAIIVSITSEKSVTGFKKVISVLKSLNRNELFEELQGWSLEGINTPLLIDYKTSEDYTNALNALYYEIADAILALNIKEEVITEPTIEEKKANTEALKEKLGAVNVFVDYRYTNRIIPFYSKEQALFFQNLLDSGSNLYDEIIKEICTKENKNLSAEEITMLYKAYVHDSIEKSDF